MPPEPAEPAAGGTGVPAAGAAEDGAAAAGIPPWMILRRPATDSRGAFFSSSKMI